MSVLAPDFSGLTEPGWPRPRYHLVVRGRIRKPDIDRLVPVPWVTPVPRFSQTDPMRRMESKDKRLCQVCGHGHRAGAETIVFLHGGLRTSDGKEMDRDAYTNAVLRAIDDSVMHERCARLSAGSCPRLQALRKADELWAFAGPIEAVELYDDQERPIEYPAGQHEAARVELPRFETFLGMQGARARQFEI